MTGLIVLLCTAAVALLLFIAEELRGAFRIVDTSSDNRPADAPHPRLCRCEDCEQIRGEFSAIAAANPDLAAYGQHLAARDLYLIPREDT